jgi:hypothetical protein
MVLFFKITPWKQLKHQGKTLVNNDKYKMNFVTNKKLPNVVGASRMNWHTLKLFDRFKCEFEMKTTKEQGVGDMLPGLQHFGGRGACWSSEMGLGIMKNT